MSKVTLLFAAPEFYSANPKKIATESCPVSNRTYFMLAGQIVAVGTFA